MRVRNPEGELEAQRGESERVLEREREIRTNTTLGVSELMRK